jgi:hypothetical protein
MPFFATSQKIVVPYGGVIVCVGQIIDTVGQRHAAYHSRALK